MDSLDGLARTLISHRIGEWDVMIGGGPDVFIVTAQNSAQTRIANAISESGTTEGEDDDDDDDTIGITVGEQAIDYPREYVLIRSEALRALGDLSSGVLPSERWEVTGDA